MKLAYETQLRFGGFGKGSCASPNCNGTRKGKASIRQPDGSYKKKASPLCPRCTRYYQGKGTLKEGVSLVKKDYCENKMKFMDAMPFPSHATAGTDGVIFDFTCRTIHDQDGSLPNNLLHLDHIVSERDDGPNTADNLRTLCGHCHDTYSLEIGDYVNRTIRINKGESDGTANE